MKKFKTEYTQGKLEYGSCTQVLWITNIMGDIQRKLHKVLHYADRKRKYLISIEAEMQKVSRKNQKKLKATEMDYWRKRYYIKITECRKRQNWGEYWG